MTLEPHIDGLIPLFAGILWLLMSTGKIETNLAWFSKHAGTMKMISIVLIIGGILQTIGFLG